jgi:hypothetical protein
VAIVYLVSAFPGAERLSHEEVVERVRRLLPGALLVDVLLPPSGTGAANLGGSLMNASIARPANSLG